MNKQIIIHHTVPSIPKESRLDFHMNSGNVKATHFVIDKNGTINTP